MKGLFTYEDLTWSVVYKRERKFGSKRSSIVTISVPRALREKQVKLIAFIP